MIFTVTEAKKHISSALNKFKATKLNHWSSNGSTHHKFQLPSGTILYLTTTPCFDGENIEVSWQWILN